jgi:hypothetical protein
MKKLWRPGYDNPKRNGYLKQMRRRWMVLPCLLAIVALPAACLFSVQEAASASPPVAKDGQPGESTFSQIVTLLNDYYPKCKIAKTADKLHFEYRAHMFANAYTSREELAPEDSGIVGDIILKAGPRSPGDKSPKIENQYYYCALTLAPYSQQSDKHLNVVLRYAPDTSPEFIKHFTTIVDEFGGESQSEQLANAAPPAVPNKEAAPATATLIETNAIKPPAQSKTAAQVTSPPPVAAKSVSTDKGRPLFLWKAVRGKEVVYLSGTVHLAGADLYPLPGEIDDAFDQSKQLMVEVAIDRRKLDPAKIQQLIKTSGTYLAPDKLSKHLSPETHKALDAYLAWAGESWAMYEQYKPWYVAQAIEESLPRRGDVMKIKGGLGIDRYLLARVHSFS